MEELSILKERCQFMHARKEELIAKRKELLSQITVINNGIKQLDDLIESNLEHQQIYWPHCHEPEEIVICSDIFSDYMANPNQTLAELSVKFNRNPETVSKQISFHLLKYGKNLEGVCRSY